MYVLITTLEAHLCVFVYKFWVDDVLIIKSLEEMMKKSKTFIIEIIKFFAKAMFNIHTLYTFLSYTFNLLSHPYIFDIPYNFHAVYPYVFHTFNTTYFI